MVIGKEMTNKLRNLDSPFIVYDIDLIKNKYSELKKNFPKFEIFYAMKSNSNPKIIDCLKNLESGFEVASLNETKQLLSQKVKPEKIICMHPIKSPKFLEFLAKNEIEVVAADSYEEVDKIKHYAPKSKVVVRLEVDNQGSGWNLSRKFGITPPEASELISYIKSLGLTPYGLTFHVGSQCLNLSNWQSALRECAKVFEKIASLGINLEFLSIGGGMPVEYKPSVPKIEEVSRHVLKDIERNFPNPGSIKFAMEPGRYLVAESGVLVSEVVGTATRGKQDWLYIDVGTYNGLIEAIETPDRNFYPIYVKDGGRNKKGYNIGGPSCVGLDTPFEDLLLPELKVGDRLYIGFAGAYTAACGAAFNGFPVPSEYFLNEL